MEEKDVTEVQNWIIRWDAPVLWEDGLLTNLHSLRGTRGEAEEFAARIEKDYGIRTESIA